MGIEGLSNLVKPCLESICLYSLRGQRAAIDAMSFMYKGCYGYAFELNTNIDTKDYMIYLLRIVRVVKQNGIEPIVVFDGRSLKAKALTMSKREGEKKKNFEKAQKLLEAGDRVEANKYFSRCLRITKDMIYETIDMLRVNQIKYLISPYEADSQVAHMVINKNVDFAITEDSDLVCYACPRIVFKLQLDSTCQYLDLPKFTNSFEKRSTLGNESLRCFLGQSDLNRIYICIMAGSDYFPSIQGIGLKKAIEYFNKCSNFK